MEYSDDLFSLKWSNFRSSLTDGFLDFLQEEMMVDVTLAAEGKFMQAHKLVLSVCSPYFKNLFNVNPCKHPIVILKDVSYHELSYALQFMYKGEVGVKHEELPSFLKLADTLKLKGLAGVKVENEKGCSGASNNNKRRISSSDVENIEDELGSYKIKGMQPTRKKKRPANALRADCSKTCHSRKRKLGNRQGKLGHNMYDSDSVGGDSDNKSLIESDIDKEIDKGLGLSDSRSSLDNEYKNDDTEGKASAGECEVATLLDGSTDVEQTPQEFIKCSAYPKRTVKKSYIWKYFVKYQSSATCKLCGKNFKGFRPHTSIEFHLKNKHPREHGEFILIREKQRQIVANNHYAMLSKLFEKVPEHLTSSYSPESPW